MSLKINAIQWRRVELAVVVALAARPASAADSPDVPVSPAAAKDAAAYYDQGIHAIEQEDYSAALTAFERAYATQPTFQVTYNIALAHAALNHPAAAVEYFERYLSEGGSRIEKSRANAVKELIAKQRKLYGVIELKVQPAPTRVSIDSQQVSETTIAIEPGTHLVKLERSGYETSEMSIVVTGGGQVDVTTTLTPLRLVTVNCRTPDVIVRWGEHVLATTNGLEQTEAELPARSIAIRMSRPGYEDQTVLLSQNQVNVTCALEPVHATSTLFVKSRTRGASIHVDGASGGQSWQLVPGRHVVDVAQGAARWVRVVDIEPNETKTLDVALSEAFPSSKPSTSEKEVRDSLHPALTFGLMGLGVAMAAAGGGLLYYNTLRNNEWVSGGRDESQRAPLETSVRNTDALGYALLGLGAVSFAGGGWLYLTHDGLGDAKADLGLSWVTAF